MSRPFSFLGWACATGRLARGVGVSSLIAGCASAPSPVWPGFHGAIGTCNRGVLADGTEVRPEAEGLRWLRKNDRHWAIARFTRAIERAALVVSRQRPGGTLVVGDLSTRTGGGPLLPHFSHRSGTDADLLFYVTTLEGAPVESPGFVHFGADGLARDEPHDRWLRLDVARQWLLVRTLLEDPQARVQWVFVSDSVKAMLLEWALASGDSISTIARAVQAMLQPSPGGIHDDHIHVRTSCSPEEIASGCEPSGPRRAWLGYDAPVAVDDDAELAVALMQPPSASAIRDDRPTAAARVKSRP